MSGKKRKRHGPEEIVRKLRDVDAMLTAGRDQAAAVQALEVIDSTYHRWRNQYGGMKSEEAKRLKQLVADLSLDNQMLKHVASGNPRGERVGPRSTLQHTDSVSFPAEQWGAPPPFAEAHGGDRASRRVRGLRAKGVRGHATTLRAAPAAK